MIINVVIELLYYSNRLARDDELNDEYKWKKIHILYLPNDKHIQSDTHTNEQTEININILSLFSFYFMYTESQ